VNKPNEEEGGCARQSRSGRANGGDLELLQAGTVGGREAGDGCCAQAILPPKQLGGDEQIAKVLQEALVVRPSEARVDRLLWLQVSGRAWLGGGSPYRTCGVNAGDGPVALVYAQRLGELVADPGLERRGASRREAGHVPGTRGGR
jgi:hypothetical protein